MSLPVIAIIVASLSAAGTVANMVAAWSNYRRVRPKVKTRGHFDVSRDGTLSGTLYFENRGQAPIEMTGKGYVVFRAAKQPLLLNRRDRIKFGRWYDTRIVATKIVMKLTLPESEPLEIPGFGGATRDFQCNVASYIGIADEIPLMASVVTYQSNGIPRQSQWRLISEYRQKAGDDQQQLTFDDV
ncbi:hypothetical protein [Streptomyces griseorubiginosus]|uniref:hypothetical protein n=1 Tax=Streptomyces griseorubiginosus TaxID=67304 RepID=UPI002E80E324|nr:hypothetical protein [Streptomyces griseorubiginosus]WUB46180.1 hypothetical protein OHN19_23730 [Streptomyces griseorubiginosus]WUB54701.1 hypothetical protein OG942_23730 [Streptomyces griseorubiginosus]